jgi:hypothetical protein
LSNANYSRDNQIRRIWALNKISNTFSYQIFVIDLIFGISAMPWRPILVVEETGIPGENHRPWASKPFTNQVRPKVILGNIARVEKLDLFTVWYVEVPVHVIRYISKKIKLFEHYTLHSTDVFVTLFIS